MSVAGGHTNPSIGSQWIKANTIGAVVGLVMTLIAFLIGQALGVSEPGTSKAIRIVFVLIATAALAFGLFVLGYLSGVVLRTKLPAFPMRTWLALYIVLGAIFGSISAIAWLTPDTSGDIGLVDADIALGLMLGAAIAGAAIGAATGVLQALVLRPAAEGLGRWIACCTLAGLLFVLVVPAVLYGPQSSFAQELVLELVTLAVTVLAAIILVPAVNRLRPR